MSKESLVVGIDIGTSSVRTVIAMHSAGDELPRVIGTGISPSHGMRRGAVIDLDEIAQSVVASIEQAEGMADVAVTNAFFSVGGTGVGIQLSHGVVSVGKADGEVVDDDIERVLLAAQAVSVPINKEILHVIPKKYRLDDQYGVQNPVGMNGVRLEVEALLIDAHSQHMKNLTNCAATVDVTVNDMILGILASSRAILTKQQKELGVILIDLGAGTTSIAVYEEQSLIHTAVLPIGAGHITNDIAIGLRTSISVAEQIKLEYGSAFASHISESSEIDLSLIDSAEDGVVSHRHVAEIIEARLEEIFTLILRELRTIGKSGLLPAGAVLVGGGAKLPYIIDFAKSILGLPAHIGYPQRLGGILDKVDDPSFSTSVGLVLWAYDENATYHSRRSFSGKRGIFHHMSGFFSSIFSKIHSWMNKFLP